MKPFLFGPYLQVEAVWAGGSSGFVMQTKTSYSRFRWESMELCVLRGWGHDAFFGISKMALLKKFRILLCIELATVGLAVEVPTFTP